MADNPNAKQAKAFNTARDEIELPEPLMLVPLVGSSGWPTFIRTADNVRYNYDSGLTLIHNTPCYVQESTS